MPKTKAFTLSAAIKQRAGTGANGYVDDFGGFPETGQGASGRQLPDIDLEMAQLRSRAVQARKLAEHIENLSRSTDDSQRMQTNMTTSTDSGGQTTAERRRRTDARPPATGQMNFNPLHPSMELPPEQLIRLLGLEPGKTRNKRKRKKAKKPAPQRTQPATTTRPGAGPAAVVKPARETAAPPAFDEPQRRGLLLPSAIAGILLGGAVSAWLFLGSGEPGKTVASAPAQTEVPARPATASATEPKPAPAATPATPPAPVVTARPSVAEKPAPQPVQRTDDTWRAEVQTELQRLRAEARQRFETRLAAPPAVVPEITESGSRTEAPESQPGPVTAGAPQATPETVPAAIVEPAPVSGTGETGFTDAAEEHLPQDAPSAYSGHGDVPVPAVSPESGTPLSAATPVAAEESSEPEADW